MPIKVTAVAAAGEVHPSPFIGPINHTATVRLDVSALTTYEVDAYGYLKPGVLLTRSGLLPSFPALVNTIGTVLISATAEKFKTTTTMIYTIAGLHYSKAATDNLTFTAAHTITASKFGCILLQINAAGTVSTKVVSATQAYDTAAAALAALPAADADNLAFAYIAIANNSGDWVANTDDMTNASDVTTATFNDVAATYEVNNAFKAFGAIVEAVKVATNNTTGLAAATDIDVPVATICQINRDILEDSLGRALTTAELNNKSDSIVITNT